MGRKEPLHKLYMTVEGFGLGLVFVFFLDLVYQDFVVIDHDGVHGGKVLEAVALTYLVGDAICKVTPVEVAVGVFVVAPSLLAAAPFVTGGSDGLHYIKLVGKRFEGYDGGGGVFGVVDYGGDYVDHGLLLGFDAPALGLGRGLGG